ncbi:D-beta-hydroxybutyrate dehydrogenase, mitochondrial-like isoform X3 [Haemaphysalis longicornis]
MMHVILLNDVLLWATTSPIPWTLVLGLSICLGPTLVCCGYWLFWNIRRAFFNGLVDSDGKSVLITGCDTGFGHLLAKKLAEEGFYVYAGCLDSNSDGASCLRLVANVRVLQLDVTRDHQIDQAFELISNSDGITALWAIVANAGVGSAGKLEWYSTAEIRRLFEVNVFGVTSVVLKFLPLMKKSRGRIVIVASMFGSYWRLPVPPWTAMHSPGALNYGGAKLGHCHGDACHAIHSFVSSIPRGGLLRCPAGLLKLGG